MSNLTYQPHRFGARALFSFSSLALLCSISLGIGCQQVDSWDSDLDDVETDDSQAFVGNEPSASLENKGVDQAFTWTMPIVAGDVGAPSQVVPTCVTITDGVGGGSSQDALLAGDFPNSPSGAYFGMWTGVSSGGNLNYSLLKFNLAGIPTGNNVVVTSATLSVYVSWNAQNNIVSVHKALQPWDESSVTLANYPSSNWDFASVGGFQGGGVGTRSVDVTSLAQQWLSGQAPNHGVVLEEGPVANHYYFTREASTASQRPSLQVCYSTANTPLPWQKVISGAGNQTVYSVASGSDNSVVALGTFEQSVNLGGSTLTSVTPADAFLVKYDVNGNHLWNKQFGSLGASIQPSGSAVAADGSVYIIGSYTGTATFGGGSFLAQAGSNDIFLAKFDADGNHLWSKSYGAAGYDGGRTVAVAPNGEIYIGGIAYIPHPLSGVQLNFGGPNASASFATDVPSAGFVVHLTANGDFLHQGFVNTSGAQIVTDLATDSLGRPTLAGWMEEGVGFCATAIGAVGQSDFNEAGLSTGLGCRWGTMVGQQFSHDYANAVAIGPNDSPVLGGRTGEVAPFGNIVDATYAGLHVRKHESNGALLWDKKFSAGAVNGVGVDSTGLIWAAGTYYQSLNVTGGTALAAPGGFVVRLDSNGNGVYQTSFGTSVTPRDLAVSADSSGIVAGSFTGSANFGAGSTSANGTDAFIVKMVQ